MMIRGASHIAVLALSRLATLFADEAQPAGKLWLRSASVGSGMRHRCVPATAVLATLALMVSACASMSANQRRHIFQDVPATIDANARYLFHMHGSIVEDQGPNAQGRYGQYRYYSTVEALADRGFVVISEVRSRTQILTYATTVASQVAKLRAAGVPASHITVTGISKGGEITVLTTAAIADPDVRFVVMAGCGRLDMFNVAGGLKALGRRPQGRVLSIYDRSDREAGSCARYLTEAPGLTFKEVILDDGRGHALFYTPERVWLDRVVEWAADAAPAMRGAFDRRGSRR